MTTPPPVPRAGPSRASLERRLPLLISLLLAMVVIIYCYAAYRGVRTSSVAAATDHLQTVARQLADLSRGTRVQQNAAFREIAADSAVVQALAGHGSVDAVQPVIARAEPSKDSASMGWKIVGADGITLLSFGPPTVERDEQALRVTIEDVARTDSVRRSPFYGVGDRVLTWIVAPVHSGSATGFVAERRRIANSSVTQQAIRDLTGQDVMIFITNRDADLWTTLRGQPIPPPLHRATLKPTFEVVSRDGGRVFGAAADISLSPWVFVLTLPEQTVLGRPRQFLRRMLAIGVLLLAAGAAGAWILSRHVTRPLRAVTRAADAVASGDYSQRVAITRRDELGRLGATFNAMASRIGESHDELARRVEQSTSLATELAQRNHELHMAQEETLRAVSRTERLQSVTAALAGALDFEAVTTVLVTQGLAAAGAQAGVLFLLVEEGRALELVRAEGYRVASLAQWSRVPIELPLPATHAARTGEPVYLRSTAEWAERFTSPREANTSGYAAWASLPLVAAGRVIAVLGLSFGGEQSFDGDTRSLLLALARQCGQALDRAMLFDAAVQARNAADEARLAAQSANRAKSSFLAMMSHELRTPLNAIGGYAELLALGLRGPVTEAQIEDLRRVCRNKDHLLTIINDILNLARIEAGQLSMQTADVPLGALLADVDALIAPQVAAKRIQYDVSGVSPGVAVRADRERLQQVVLNIVSNAVRFTDPGGAVTVWCEERGERVLVHVRDTGIGIAPDDQEAVFEPFYQVDAGLTRRAGGTGLGLAISRDLTVSMGGSLTLESTLGRGSIFTLDLPAAGLAPHRATPEHEASHA